MPTQKGGGAGITLCDAFNHAFPNTAGIVGTFDWIHRSFTVRTPSADKMKKRPYVMPWMLHGQGTAWFDGLLVEEVKE